MDTETTIMNEKEHGRSIDNSRSVEENAGGPSPPSPHPPSTEYVLNFAFYSFVGFMAVQSVFALIARSESMLADSEAMSVDALTYLFNLGAERYKHRPWSDEELALTTQQRHYQREMHRLYLELVPPAISVATLMFVTFLTLRDASATLIAINQRYHYESGAATTANYDDDHDVSVPIMLVFSSANLILDLVNVTCFARSGSAFGLNVVGQKSHGRHRSTSNRMSLEAAELGNRSSGDAIPTNLESGELDETSLLIQKPINVTEDDSPISHYSINSDTDDDNTLVNLNMCSAWTHICADTMRSTAVLIAAGIAAIVPNVRSDMADSVAAIAVSIIILGSLVPLLHGLYLTAINIIRLHRNPNSEW